MTASAAALTIAASALVAISAPAAAALVRFDGLDIDLPGDRSYNFGPAGGAARFQLGNTFIATPPVYAQGTLYALTADAALGRSTVAPGTRIGAATPFGGNFASTGYFMFFNFRPAGTDVFGTNLVIPLTFAESGNARYGWADVTVAYRGAGQPLSMQLNAWAYDDSGAGVLANVFQPSVAGDGSFRFDVPVVAAKTVWIDPPVATGYEYRTGSGNPLFASVTLPAGVGDNRYALWLWNGTAYVEGAELTGGVSFAFASALDRFQVRGIEPSAALDPADTGAFVTGLTFAGSGRFTGTMTPLLSAVPEPAAPLLWLGGLGAVLWTACRRRPPSGN